MSVIVQFKVDNTGAKQLFKQKGAQIIAALEKKITYLMLLLQQKIQNEKLSGQVLNQRSGTLKGSINVVPTTINGDELIGQVTGAGGPAWYGKVHEYGGTKSYAINPVNKKVLAFNLGGKKVFAKYAFHPPLPKRSFMLSSLEEMRERIITELQAAVGEAIVE